MNTNGQRLRKLIEGAGLTQEKSLELFNNARPKLFDAYSLSAWKAFLADTLSARWRPFSDKLMERAEKIFTPMQNSVGHGAQVHLYLSLINEPSRGPG